MSFSLVTYLTSNYNQRFYRKSAHIRKGPGPNRRPLRLRGVSCRVADGTAHVLDARAEPGQARAMTR
jgi:hypothetical protein